MDKEKLHDELVENTTLPEVTQKLSPEQVELEKMLVGDGTDIWERRHVMIAALVRGVGLREVVNFLAVKGAITPAAIYKDYRQRYEWFPIMLGFDDTNRVIVDHLIELKGLEASMQEELRSISGEDDKIKERAIIIDKIREFKQERFELMQSLGIVPEKTENEAKMTESQFYAFIDKLVDLFNATVTDKTARERFQQGLGAIGAELSSLSA